METAGLVDKADFKEEIEPECSGIKEDHSLKKNDEVFEKVLFWFKKNDELSVYEYLETLSIKSQNESISSIKTPSIISETEPSNENSKASSVIKVKKDKPPVQPIALNHGEIYDVTITNFKCLDSFFVTVRRDTEKSWHKLIRRLKRIPEEGRLKPLEGTSRGTLCLVQINNEIHRAIVQNTHPTTAICFGIDTGKVYIIDKSKDSVYYMSRKIRNTIEFQAINCRLFDVRMPHEPEISKFIYDTIISKIEYPQIKVIKTKSSRFIDDSCMPLINYEVMLFDNESDVSINDQIGCLIQGRIGTNEHDSDDF